MTTPVGPTPQPTPINTAEQANGQSNAKGNDATMPPHIIDLGYNLRPAYQENVSHNLFLSDNGTITQAVTSKTAEALWDQLQQHSGNDTFQDQLAKLRQESDDSAQGNISKGI